jgi:His-Xaa-Ser system protein HxsD
MLIKVNPNIYPIEAVLSASFKFIDKLYIFLEMHPKKPCIMIHLKAKKAIYKRRLESLKGCFVNELLHCALRLTINKNTKKIREYIIGRALYSSLPTNDLSNIEVSGNGQDYLDDPLGIAIPWEDKYGKKNARDKV